jgi:TolB-like protein
MQFRMGIHLGDVAIQGERLFGDGVNIAARLQAIANPGGVCVSGNVYDLVHTKLGVGFDDLGTQSVKNIPDPVRVYSVRAKSEVEPGRAPRSRTAVRLGAGLLVLLMIAGLALWALERDEAGDEAFTVPDFGGVPAIAVLAFDNLSGDPDQEYFADGIAEDLITRLSRGGGFPVIARNSSFTYKGQAVDVQQVGRELGARYVVEGSVRRSGDRVRISAQLIDSTTGSHVWAETYDRKLQDIFTLQDEITKSIGASLGIELWQAELERSTRTSSENLGSYDYALRGFWHLWRATREDNARAQVFFQRATELDSRSTMASLGLAFAHWFDIRFQWTDSPARSVAELDRFAKQCISLDSKLAGCHRVMGLAHHLQGQTDRAIAALELALQLNPSAAHAYHDLGLMLAVSGRPADGIAKIETSMRLSPRDPGNGFRMQSMALAHFAAGRYEEAVGWTLRALQHKPDDHNSHAILAASYGRLGRLEQARAEFREVLRLQPDYSLAGVKLIFRGADPEFVERFVDGLRKAGLEEQG